MLVVRDVIKGVCSIVFVVLSTVTVAYAQLADVNMSKKIVVTSEEIRFDSLISLICKQTGAKFSLNTRKFPPSKVIHVKKGVQPAGQLLEYIREHTGIYYRVLGSHIIFVDDPPVKPIATGKSPVTPVSVVTVKKPVVTAVIKKPVAYQREDVDAASVPVANVIVPDTAVAWGAVPDMNVVAIPQMDVVLRPMPSLDAAIVKKKNIALMVKPILPVESLKRVQRETPVDGLHPFVKAGITGDESFYVNPAIHAGLPFVYLMASWSTNFTFSSWRYGIGSSIKIADDWRLHLQVSTGQLVVDYDSIGYLSKSVKAHLHKVAFVTEKRLSDHFRLQLGVAVNSLQTKYFSNGVLTPLRKDENTALQGIQYFKPVYTIRNNFSPSSTQSNKLWIGMHVGILYNLNFFRSQ
jgi:hypothetical protein